MKTKDKITFILLWALYLLVSCRYIAGDFAATAKLTAGHLLQTVPFIAGLTIFVVIILQKVAGGRLPLDRSLRIYLTFGLLAEFFFGLINYTGQGVG